MSRYKHLHVLAAVLLIIMGATVSTGQVEAVSPVITSGPPRPPTEIVPPVQPPPALTHVLGLPAIKAVLLVGPIDGNDGSWTRQEIANMELAAAVLEAHGVTVHRFYPGTGTFAGIEQAAQGAHFLLYRGHGVYDGNLPHPNVGGFSLSSGYYSPERIRQNLHLASNAMVMLYGCFTAGSSSATGDEHDIGIAEASRRVAQYADPFFDAGAAGYYANWFGNAFEQFLTNLFAGRTLGQAYENYFDFNPNTVYRTTHPDHPAMSMWVDKDNWGYWQYNNAFVGRSDRTLQDLFTPELGGLPAAVRFSYSIPYHAFLAGVYVLMPKNTGSSATLDWQVTTDRPWLHVTPQSGKTPQGFTLTVAGFDVTTVATYSGFITVAASGPAPVYHSPQVLPVTLEVIDRSFEHIYLPLILRQMAQ